MLAWLMLQTHCISAVSLCVFLSHRREALTTAPQAEWQAPGTSLCSRSARATSPKSKMLEIRTSSRDRMLIAGGEESGIGLDAAG